MLPDSRSLPPESDNIQLWIYARGKRQLLHNILCLQQDSKIVLDMLTEKFNIKVDDNTVTQLTLLHSDIPGYDLPALDFVSPPEEAQENHILKKTLRYIHT